MIGRLTPEQFTERQLQAMRQLVTRRAISELARFRPASGESIRNLRLAKTVARDGTYPATGNTFAIRFVDCGFSPLEPGSSTLGCQDRTAEGDTDDADDVIAREINGEYIDEGTYVVALWQRGVEGDPEDYGEWWIRLAGVPGGPCWEWSDDFNRADSTDVGADWNEVVGNWEILSNELHQGGTANSRIFCNQPVPNRSRGEMYVAIDVVDPEDGDYYFIFPSCPDNETEGNVSVTFQFTGPATWTISITAPGGSAATEQTVALAGGKAGLYVCCDFRSDAVFAGVAGGISTDPDIGPAWLDHAGFTAGRYVALGHNNASGATFDDFILEELRSTDEDCHICACACDGIVPSKHLVLTVTSGTDRAACLEGEDADLYWTYGSGTSYWEGDLVSADNSPTTTIRWRLQCDTSGTDATAWAAPGTVASGITGVGAWSDPNNAKVDDDFNYATAPVELGEPSEYLKCTNFGFSIPDDVTITGVEVNIQRMDTVAGDVEDYGVYLYNGESLPVFPIGDNKKDPDAWPGWGSEESVKYGGDGDTWGWTLTKAIVEGAAFGVAIAAVGKSGTSRTAEIDYVEMKIYYRYYSGYNWKLNISNGSCCASNPGGCSAVFRALPDSSCNPLSLDFGPFYLSKTDLTCWACQDPGAGDSSGTYYVSISEAP